MGIVHDLSCPVIAAPMAGGPSTPALVDAADAAGSLGFLAGGYLGESDLVAQMEATRAARFGVNLFCPQAAPRDSDLAAVTAYAGGLVDRMESLGLDPGEIPRWLAAADPEDGFGPKFDAVCATAGRGVGPAVVSCTFGVFSGPEIDRLHGVGIEAWATVADVPAARDAVDRGIDTLIVQGPGAGGHRATRTVAEEPGTRSLADLVTAVHRAVDGSVPLVAAGGLSDRASVGAALTLPGVVAVACGTALLLSDEAGTTPVHRAALAGAPRTVVTRAYSGRPARGVATPFTEGPGAAAPAVYPGVNAVMRPLRAAAGRRGEADLFAAWAGTGVSHARSGSAAEILRHLGGL
ncbi:nitronate monooxygenase [Corynebacterium sp. P7202]|uniref:Propionate 3-nitronate monooxygenase n=1 Tax=Corynebacterium pygosceleis TaxID=2800406 RepID=A0A9Q4GIY4_9CORY|nr:nitronate monooxygenase [Corynebacterium pygosceleis]MCK7638085.1 nitronate monooxygenase [Corynebacterium pygosceleis]MCX7444360.1 nitronate monooxygenase [Corynebacterium pygosceleis]MCX7468801.1 nitronate monooxygenase [Corynebacterium pygosceleis]